MNVNNPFGISPEQMFGEGTVHVPFNFISQGAGDANNGKYAGLWQFQHSAPIPLLDHSEHQHILVMGDVFIRPKLVLPSTGKTHGLGISGLYQDGFSELSYWDHKNPIYQKE